jgi:hypothetical protein
MLTHSFQVFNKIILRISKKEVRAWNGFSGLRMVYLRGCIGHAFRKAHVKSHSEWPCYTGEDKYHINTSFGTFLLKPILSCNGIREFPSE